METRKKNTKRDRQEAAKRQIRIMICEVVLLLIVLAGIVMVRNGLKGINRKKDKNLAIETEKTTDENLTLETETEIKAEVEIGELLETSDKLAQTYDYEGAIKLLVASGLFTSNSTVDREVLASELMEKQSGKGLRIVKNKKKTEKIIPKCTDEIEEFVDKYPESLSLAVNYPKWHDKEPEMKLKKADMEGNRIPLLFQWDKRWAYQEYGDGILGTTGCGPTSLVMVYSGITGKRDYSPAHMAKWAEKKGYYVENVGSSWLLMSEGAEELGLNVKTLHITKEEIEKELQDGKVVICSMHAGDFTQSGHFIVLTGMEQDGTICINDCNSPERSQKQWDLDTIIEQMDAGWSYSL